jgi:histidine triad (HIT) family protein
VHLLLIPKIHVASMADVTAEHAPLLGRMMALVPQLMLDNGAANGFRVIVNTGVDGGQEVGHLHLHAIGGPRPWAKG